MLSRFRLRTVLAAAFGVSALALASAGSLAVQQLTGSRARLAAGAEMADVAEQIRNLLDRSMFERWREIDMLADVATTSAATPEARRTWIDAMQRTLPAYAWIGFADRDGRVQVSTGGLLEGANLAGRPWFKGGLLGPLAVDVHDAALLASKLPPSPSGEPLRFVDVAAPVREPGGAVRGVIGAHLSWAWAGDITRSVLETVSDHHLGVEAFVIAKDGLVLLGPNALRGTRIEPAITMPLLAAAEQDRDAFTDAVWPDGSSFLVAASRTRGFSAYPGLGWTVVVRQPSDIAYGPGRVLGLWILAGGGVLALVFAAVGWWTAARLARPLDALTQSAMRAHRDGIAALPGSFGGSAELVSLSASLTALLGQIGERDRALAAANADLEERVTLRTRDLEETTTLLSLAQEAAGAGTWQWDWDCDAILMSPESARLYGFSPDSPGRIPTKVCTGRIHPEDSERTLGEITEAVRQKRSFAVEFRVCRPEGGEIWILGLGRGQYDAAGTKLIRMVGLNLDISGRKTTEFALKRAIGAAEEARGRAEAASQAKTDFLASMSHEIRTPLNGVLGFAELLLKDPALSAAPRRHVQHIREAGSALLTVVNDILDFSRIESGQIALDPQPFSLAALVDGSLSIVRGYAEKKGLTLTVAIDPVLATWFNGDPARLRQILLNLLNNAVKFTSHGTVGLRLAPEPARDGRQAMRIAVSDTGIGIPEAKRDRLFKRFSQVDATTGRDYGGTGLGLAISKRLVELMGGTIGVESREGAGSTFWFTLVLERANAPATDRPAAGQSASLPSGIRILLVEDGEINRELAGEILRAAGCEVEAVSDGAAAVAAVQRNRYDLVLMDVQMPGMDGITATRIIRALEGGERDVPIVALSANVLPFQTEEMTAAGMNDCLGKPFEHEQLYATIARWRRKAPSSRNEPVLDRHVSDTMLSLIGRDSLLSLFDQLAHLLSERFDAAVSDPLDLGRLAEEAHLMVSPSGMLGFTAFSRLCRQLERARLEGRDVAGIVAELKAARAAMPAAMDAFRQAA